MNDLALSSVQTMSSREIAKLTGKRHDHVMRDIRAMYAELEISPDLGIGHYKSGNRKYELYNLDKNLTLTLISGYSTKLRSSIVSRWTELEAKEKNELARIGYRTNARLESKELTNAVKHDKEKQGKEAKHYHYSNEQNMINKIALGMTAKKYREEHDLDKNDSIRDTLSLNEIKCIEHLQRANTTMIEIGLEYEERKNKLNKLYMEFHARALMAEVELLEG